MPGTLIVLPGRAEMLRRLRMVSRAPAHEEAYPEIIDSAEARVYSSGVANLLFVCVEELEVIPRFLAALIDDEQALEEALRYFDYLCTD